MSLLWGAIQGIGSLVGLLTGIFIVWDRFNKSPSAIVIARPVTPGGVAKALYLEVRNRSDRPILVSWKSGMPAGEFGLSEGHGIRQIVAAIIDGHRTLVIDRNQRHEFVLLRPSDSDQIDPDNRVELNVFWRYAQPILWQRDRRLRVRVPMRSLMLMTPEEYRSDHMD